MAQNAPPPKNRLHQLCCSRSPMALELVRSLLSRGSNPRERGDEGLTPLHAAAAYDNIAICQLLLHFGADVNAKDDLGRTPLTMAIGNTKTFLARYIEKDRRTRRGLLRRIFVCQAGIYSPEPKQKSFVKDLRSKVRSFGLFKRRESKTNLIIASEVAVVVAPPVTPRRRARTPEVLERVPKSAVKVPKRSKTPDFEPDIKNNSKTNATPKFDNVTKRTPKTKTHGNPSQHTSVIKVTPKKAPNKLPPRKMVTPSAPPLTPKTPAKAATKTPTSAPNVTTRKGRKIDISSESEYITAEESLGTEELEKRLSQLQIRVVEPAPIDENKLRAVRRLKDTELRSELQKLGIAAGPICSRTRKLYEKKLLTAMEGYNAVVKDAKKYSRQLEMAFNGKFDFILGQKLDEAIKAEFNNTGVTAFVYILIDPRILGSESKPSLKLFVEALFYIGKGTKARPLAHLIDAKRYKLEKSSKLETSKKFSRINSIWNSGHGVGLLELSHTISDKEAFTREAAFIEALRLENLCNIKGGEWHGITRQWDIVSRATLGVYLLEQARTILHTLSIRRVFPEDLPDTLYPFVNTRRR